MFYYLITQIFDDLSPDETPIQDLKPTFHKELVFANTKKELEYKFYHKHAIAWMEELCSMEKMTKHYNDYAGNMSMTRSKIDGITFIDNLEWGECDV